MTNRNRDGSKIDNFAGAPHKSVRESGGRDTKLSTKHTTTNDGFLNATEGNKVSQLIADGDR